MMGLWGQHQIYHRIKEKNNRQRVQIQFLQQGSNNHPNWELLKFVIYVQGTWLTSYMITHLRSVLIVMCVFKSYRTARGNPCGEVFPGAEKYSNLIRENYITIKVYHPQSLIAITDFDDIFTHAFVSPQCCFLY